MSEPILKPSANLTIKADAYFFDIDGTLTVSRDLVHWHAMHQAMLEVYGLDANSLITGKPTSQSCAWR